MVNTCESISPVNSGKRIEHGRLALAVDVDDQRSIGYFGP